MTKSVIEFIKNIPEALPAKQVAESLTASDFFLSKLIDQILVLPEFITGQPGTLLILSEDLQPEGLELLVNALRGIRGYRIDYPVRKVIKEIKGK